MNQVHLELCSSAEWAEAVQRWIIPWVLDGIELGDDVLEVGPGPGRTTEVLATMVPRLTAAEVDADLAAALAERLGGRGVDVDCADATRLPYPDGRFSAVLCFTMLHHVPSAAAQDRLFAEAARVLHAGGRFAGIDSVDGEDFRALHVDDVCVPVDPSGLPPRLEAAGFSAVAVEVDEGRLRFQAVTPQAEA